MLRCSNKKCENHKPNDQTYFNWSYPYIRVSPDRILLEDLATESAQYFTCPLCTAEAEDFIPNKAISTGIRRNPKKSASTRLLQGRGKYEVFFESGGHTGPFRTLKAAKDYATRYAMGINDDRAYVVKQEDMLKRNPIQYQIFEARGSRANPGQKFVREQDGLYVSEDYVIQKERVMSSGRYKRMFALYRKNQYHRPIAHYRTLKEAKLATDFGAAPFLGRREYISNPHQGISREMAGGLEEYRLTVQKLKAKGLSTKGKLPTLKRRLAAATKRRRK